MEENQNRDTKKMKNTVLGVAILTSAVVLSACEINMSTTIDADGTGSYTIYESGDKLEVAEFLGIPESEVVSYVEDTLSSSVSGSEDVPDGYTYKVDDLGDTVAITVTTSFSYDEEGWFFGSDTNNPEGTVVNLNDDGTATFTYDTVSAGDSGLTMDEFGSDIEWSIDVTFPGEILDYSGDAEISGTTVTWGGDAVQTGIDSGEILSVTGSLDPATATHSSSDDADGNIGTILMVFGAGTVMFALGAGTVVFINSRKKQKKNDWEL